MYHSLIGNVPLNGERNISQIKQKRHIHFTQTAIIYVTPAFFQMLYMKFQAL